MADRERRILALQGRIAIPVAYQRLFGLKPGSPVEILVEEDDAIILHPPVVRCVLCAEGWFWQQCVGEEAMDVLQRRQRLPSVVTSSG